MFLGCNCIDKHFVETKNNSLRFLEHLLCFFVCLFFVVVVVDFFVLIFFFFFFFFFVSTRL